MEWTKEKPTKPGRYLWRDGYFITSGPSVGEFFVGNHGEMNLVTMPIELSDVWNNTWFFGPLDE